MNEACPTALWITDLIKIGIPAFIALLSLCLNAWLGIAGHKKDLAIEKLKFDNDRSKSRAKKRAELAAGMVDKIAAVDNAFGRYSGVFRESSSPEEVAAQQATNPALQDAFQNLANSIDACTGARTSVHLLNEPEMNARFELYLTALFGFQKYANPNTGLSIFEIQSKFDAVSQQRTETLSRLSNVYLE